MTLLLEIIDKEGLDAASAIASQVSKLPLSLPNMDMIFESLFPEDMANRQHTLNQFLLYHVNNLSKEHRDYIRSQIYKE